MTPSALFQFCPRCGSRQPAPPTGNVFDCTACGLRYFFNPAVATAVFIQRVDGRVLFIRRAKDPGLGRLAPPGGFIDFGETAEQSAFREVREEVGLGLADLKFLCSQPNSYSYADITYLVLDLFFTARAMDGAMALALDDVASINWLDPRTVSPEALAFPSMQAAWRQFRERLESLSPPTGRA